MTSKARQNVATEQQLNAAQARITDLEAELLAKSNAEKLQKALFDIALLKNDNLALTELYKNIHRIVEQLLYAKNFYILLFDEDSNEITFPYFIDEKDGDSMLGLTLPLGEGISSYVLNTRKPQNLTPQRVAQLIDQGLINDHQIGATSYTSWLGAPLLSAEMILGIIVVQSYDKAIILTDEDLNILTFVAIHVAGAIEATRNAQQRRESQINLAKHHRLLEQQNEQLNSTVKALKSMQQELIQKEKMASLGGLVAGIAHEINTPLGICVTGISHLLEEKNIFEQALKQKSLTEKQLAEFLEEVDEVGKILTTNMQRAANLIQSFKQIAVDQSSNEVRRFNLKNYIDEIILSLRPKLKRTSHQIIIHCDENFWAVTNAGAISQIMSNLILNTVNHAFDEHQSGIITIDLKESKKTFLLTFSDNGKGLDDSDMKQLFDPFFTTKRGEGGSGLGTHLIFNLVTSSLHGKLKAKSQLGQGLKYFIEFPKKID